MGGHAVGVHGMSRDRVTTVTMGERAKAGSLVRVDAGWVWGPGLAAGPVAALAALCAARGGRTQLHGDENSKCGWVAREQLLWEQAEEEFSHSEGASWGKIQEFSAAMEGRQAGRGDGDCLGIAAPTAPARDARVALPALPGLWHPGTKVLGSPTLVVSVTRSVWLCGQGWGVCSPWVSREQGVQVALPVPGSPLPSGVPAPAFGGCLVPIPVFAGGEQRAGEGVLMYGQSWNWRVWAPRTR